MEDLNDSNVLELAENAAENVLNKTKSSAQILEDLGPFLTDVNVGRRKIGLCFLSQFLSDLPNDFLNGEECRLFSAFYQDRLNDHHSLIPDIIKGEISCKNMCRRPHGGQLGVATLGVKVVMGEKADIRYLKSILNT